MKDSSWSERNGNKGDRETKVTWGRGVETDERPMGERYEVESGHDKSSKNSGDFLYTSWGCRAPYTNTE